MITIPNTLAVALLAVGLHAPLAAAPAKEDGHADPEHARLVAARKAANELPEVAAAEQQAKIDRALTTKAYAEYKTARKRSNDSETAYRKAFDAALAKVDAARSFSWSVRPSANACSRRARRRKAAPRRPSPRTTRTTDRTTSRPARRRRANEGHGPAARRVFYWARAWANAAQISSTGSRPTEMRSRSGSSPAARIRALPCSLVTSSKWASQRNGAANV